MKPLFQPQLVNDPFGDPALYVDFMFERRALLFDIGDIQKLSPRKILRISHVFVSHTHMDHFMGFDHLLRICLGRETQLHLFGPTGIIEKVEHKLASYTWNLVQNYTVGFSIIVSEYHQDGALIKACFKCQTGFTREQQSRRQIDNAVIIDEMSFRVRAVHLDHKIESLAFSLEEKLHVNVWKNKLEELGYNTGPWLRELKQAVLRGADESELFRVWWKTPENTVEIYKPLGELKATFLQIVAGQKIAYVVDAGYTPSNINKIMALIDHANLLFIETSFLQHEQAHAAQKYHLTSHQAGSLAKLAQVKTVVPFHFSTRYQGEESLLYQEVEAAFGKPVLRWNSNEHL